LKVRASARNYLSGVRAASRGRSVGGRRALASISARCARRMASISGSAGRSASRAIELASCGHSRPQERKRTASEITRATTLSLDFGLAGADFAAGRRGLCARALAAGAAGRWRTASFCFVVVSPVDLRGSAGVGFAGGDSRVTPAARRAGRLPAPCPWRADDRSMCSEPREGGQERHQFQRFGEAGVAFGLPLDQVTLQLDEAGARELNDPLGGSLVLRPVLNPGVLLRIELQVLRVELDARQPAVQEFGDALVGAHTPPVSFGGSV